MIRGTKQKMPELRADIHNRFDIEVVDAKTGNVKQKAMGLNVVCNSLWNRLLTPNPYFTYVHYGTGSGTPSAADTSLFAFSGYVAVPDANFVETCDGQNGVYSLQNKVVLDETTAVGSTLTEVGIAYGTAAGSLVTHAMLKDMSGNQISIAKTDTDIINIYATVFVHFSATGFQNGTIKMNDIIGEYTYIPNSSGTVPKIYGFMPYLAGLYTSQIRVPPRKAFIGKGVLSPTGSIYGDQAVSLIMSDVTAAYSKPNKTITLTIARLPVDKYNVLGGIKVIEFFSYISSSSQIYYFAGPSLVVTPGSGIPNSVIVGESIGTGDGSTSDFKTKFSHAHDATVYVDGIAVPTVTVDKKPITSDITEYLWEISDKSSAETIIPHDTGLREASWLYNRDGNRDIYLYNPEYEIGIYSVSCHIGCYRDGAYYLEVSNDMINWVELVSSVSDPFVFPEEYRHYKFIRTANNPSVSRYTFGSVLSGDSGYNIHFTTPPAAGAVITADYTSDTIAKDTDHVFDLTVTIQLGEYTE